MRFTAVIEKQNTSSTDLAKQFVSNARNCPQASSTFNNPALLRLAFAAGSTIFHSIDDTVGRTHTFLRSKTRLSVIDGEDTSRSQAFDFYLLLNATDTEPLASGLLTFDARQVCDLPKVKDYLSGL
jgi:hypothetical protein